MNFHPPEADRTSSSVTPNTGPNLHGGRWMEWRKSEQLRRVAARGWLQRLVRSYLLQFQYGRRYWGAESTILFLPNDHMIILSER